MGQLSVTSVDTTEDRTRRVASLRWLLLAWTLLGLAAMHTIGHVCADHAMAVPEPPGVQRPQATAMMLTEHTMHVAAAMAPLRGGHHTHAGNGGLAGGHPDGWSVCLAILTALAVALVVGWLFRAAAARSGGTRSTTPRWGAPRAPPLPAIGLRLADLSVLRR